jgi:hypothetical protein
LPVGRQADDDAARAAVTVARRRFDAVRAVGRREVPAGRRAVRVAFPVEAVGLDRVVDDVLRQHVGERPELVVRIGHHAQLEHLLEIVLRETDHPHVTEVDQAAALDARGSLVTPVADDAIQVAAHAAAEPLALPERQFVH